MPPVFDFDKAPFLILWELTRACALACKHCRAEAMPDAAEGELTLDECKKVLGEIKQFGNPLIVLTGGDPARRKDLFEIIAEARRLGLKVAMTPSATPTTTRETIARLKKAGLERLAISLDAPDIDSHDDFRQVAGSYDWTLSIIGWAREFDLPVQINTTVTKHNYHQFDEMAELVASLGAVLWSVFFLVPVGRASERMQITAAEAESALIRMAKLADQGKIDVKSTAAPHFRRVLLQRTCEKTGPPAPAMSRQMGSLPERLRLGALRSYQSVNDGKGLLFISHIGEILPSGFLPVCAGNVREQSLVDMYQNSDVFRQLRDSEQLKGKCGVCRYRQVCGGSRARAFAASGDYMESDPLCLYVEKLPMPPTPVQ